MIVKVYICDRFGSCVNGSVQNAVDELVLSSVMDYSYATDTVNNSGLNNAMNTFSDDASSVAQSGEDDISSSAHDTEDNASDTASSKCDSAVSYLGSPLGFLKPCTFGNQLYGG